MRIDRIGERCMPKSRIGTLHEKSVELRPKVLPEDMLSVVVGRLLLCSRDQKTVDR